VLFANRDHGPIYSVIGPVEGPRSRRIERMIAAWIVERGTVAPRNTAAFPDRRRRVEDRAMVTRSDLHHSVTLLEDAAGYPAGTVGLLIECLRDAAVIEIDRPEDNPDIITVGLSPVAVARDASAASAGAAVGRECVGSRA